jgi:hypothetical protein
LYYSRADDIYSCTNTLDLIWTIWDIYLGSLASEYANYPMEYVQDFDHCVSMTNAVLEYGCDIYDTVPYNPSFPNALFKLYEDAGFSTRREEALKYLLQIGYDMEQRAESGETVLLHAATALTPANIECLKSLIEKGANIHAIDAEDRGALHCAFLIPNYLRKDGELSYWEGAPRYMFEEDPEYLMEIFDIDNARYAEDYEDLHYDLDPLIRNSLKARYTPSYDWLADILIDYMSTLECSMDCSESDFQSISDPTEESVTFADNYSRMEEYNASSEASSDESDHLDGENLSRENILAEESMACADTSSDTNEHGARSEATNDESDRRESDFRSRDNVLAEKSIACADTSSSTDEPDASLETTNDEIMCLNCQRKISRRRLRCRLVMEVLKGRLRSKLLILLQAGCDPNVLDNKGKSPGDLAERLGLWPQWEWALTNAGYIYNSVNQRWIE